MKTIILASASPRRKELLEKIGLSFKVEPSNYAEDIDSGLAPHELAQKIALAKAEVVAGKHQDAIVIAADTFVVCDGKIMGKPHTAKEARGMLKTISGKSHSVITGFSIIDTAKNKTLSQSVETKVYIRKLTSAEIDAYVKSKEPLDKAGAYAIQGLGSVIVERIEGDYFNVVGLPLSALSQALEEFGVKIMIEVFIVIKDGAYRYYLLKVERRGFDVYCFPPDLGVHHSLHSSGESHFRYEGKTAKPREEPPVALVMGEAGTPIKNGIRSASLRGLGSASGICTAIFSIASLSQDFRKFNRSTGECFVIDKELFPQNVTGVEVGVWAVPDRNKVSFEFDNPDIPADLLYKIAQCEPQIWIYARPLFL